MNKMREVRNYLKIQKIWKVSSAYIKYAIGEIVLIVIGVLLAVSLNNWNSERIRDEKVSQIKTKIIKEFNDDKRELLRIREHYTIRKPLFDSIIESKYSVETIRKCKECHFLISGHLLYRPSVEGFESLKKYNQADDIDSDRISYFVQNYTALLDELELLKNNIIEDVNGNLMQWRGSYEWFTPFFQGKDNLDYYSYQANNAEYKNKVAYHYALVYYNYLPALDRFIELQNSFNK